MQIDFTEFMNKWRDGALMVEANETLTNVIKACTRCGNNGLPPWDGCETARRCQAWLIVGFFGHAVRQRCGFVEERGK